MMARKRKAGRPKTAKIVLKAKATNGLNASNLKNLLWENIHEVRVGELDVKAANAICSNARTILAIVKAEIAAAKASGIKAPSKFLAGS